MNYFTLPPSESLSEFIRCFWVLESHEPYTHYSMPDVCPEWLFHYKGQFDELLENGTSQKSFWSGIHAQTHKIRKFHRDEAFGMFGVYLYPHTIPLLLGIPAYELTNQMPELSLLLKGEGLELEEKIASATGHEQRIKIMEEFVFKKLSIHYKGNLPVFQAIQEMINNQRFVPVKKMASDYFLSVRQFQRQFQHYAGLSPKLFLRIIRFHSVMSQYGKKSKTLTEIALGSGYYDQSHFIHEFKEFSGIHPKQFFSGSSETTKWRN